MVPANQITGDCAKLWDCQNRPERFMLPSVRVGVCWYHTYFAEERLRQKGRHLLPQRLYLIFSGPSSKLKPYADYG